MYYLFIWHSTSFILPFGDLHNDSTFNSYFYVFKSILLFSGQALMLDNEPLRYFKIPQT